MRCSERIRHGIFIPALLPGLLVVPSSAFAEGSAEPEADVDAALRDINRQAGAIAEAASHAPVPGWLDAAQDESSAFSADVQAITDQAEAIIVCAQGEQPYEATDGEGTGIGSTGTTEATTTFTLFASRSLGDGQLRDLFAFAAGAADTRIVFRGVGEDESLLAFVASLQPLLADLDPPPTVLLDPTPFREHGITAVPTLVALGPNGQEIARVAGLASTRWLRQMLADGKRGDHGTRGPLRGISEPDLLETIHRRLARLDFAALGEQAVERAFDQLRFEYLPAAGEDRERLIDPTIIAAADIHLPDGTVLVRAGDTVNPLDRIPFTQRLVVFDGADSRQLGFVQALAAAPSDRSTTFLLTGLSQQDGWAELERVIGLLDRRVYLLTPELRQRFALERVPAVVDAVGRRFRITEHAVAGRITAEAAP
jgi:conjugal transfer pilus assembly protein TraW